jgi:UDP-N-acetyl-D-mannosaminuronate dehydrogenase
VIIIEMCMLQVPVLIQFTAARANNANRVHAFLADVRCVTDAVRHSDCVVVCTDWDEFKSIDWASMASEMQVTTRPMP